MSLQALIDVVALGSLYALVALGIGLVFGVMRLVNFAHGELFTAGAYLLVVTAAWPTWASLLATVVGVVALSLLVERVAFRPLRNAAPATMLVTTFAISFLLQSLALLVFGAQSKGVQVLPVLSETLRLGDLRIRWLSIVTIGLAALLLTGTILFLNRTWIGLQMRAAAIDFTTARLLGVKANTVIQTAFLVSGLLAAAGAIIFTIRQTQALPLFGVPIMIVALIGVVVGGLDRLWTATLGGFALGAANSLIGTLLPSQSRVFLDSWLFLLVIVVLLWKPNGLFARSARAVERV